MGECDLIKVKKKKNQTKELSRGQIIKNLVYLLKRLEFILWTVGKERIFGLNNQMYILEKSLV